MADSGFWSLLQSGLLWLLLLLPACWHALAKKRLTLRMIILAVAGIAIVIAHSLNDFRLNQLFASVEIRAPGGDIEAIAREILSPSVLDDALNRSSTSSGHIVLVTLPRFRGVSDPQSELRRLLIVDASPKLHALRLSMIPSPQSDERFILNAITESYDRSLGSKRDITYGSVNYITKWSLSQAHFLVFITYCWLICLGWKEQGVERGQRGHCLGAKEDIA